MHGQNGSARRLEARALHDPVHAGIAEQPVEQRGGFRGAVGGGIGLDAANEVTDHVRPVHQEGAQDVRPDQGIGQVDRNLGRERPDQKLDQAHRPGIRFQQVPAAIDHDGGERFLLAEHVVEAAAHAFELRRGEFGLVPYRRKACGQQKRVLLAQGNLEGDGEAQDHGAARGGSAQLEEAQVTLRDVRPARQLELRDAALPAPPAQPGREVGRRAHDYLSRS